MGLNNHGDDDSDFIKKQLPLWAKQQLFTCITLFGMFPWCPRYEYHVNLPMRRFMEGMHDGEVSFLFLNLDKVLKNSTPEEIDYIWQIKCIQMDAAKFEGRHIFLATFSLPSSSLLKFSTKAVVFQKLMLYVLLVVMNRILVKLMLSRGIIKSLKYGTSASVKRSKSGTTTSGCFLKKKRKKHSFIMRKFCINGS